MLHDVNIDEVNLKSLALVKEFARAKEIIRHTLEAIHYFRKRNQSETDQNPDPGIIFLLENEEVSSLTDFPRKISGQLICNPQSGEPEFFEAKIELKGIHHKIREFTYKNNKDEEFFQLCTKNLSDDSVSRETVSVRKKSRTLSYICED